jgi:hypothetical protein
VAGKTLKLLRTLRLDPSDRLVFAKAAEPGEWAVTGSFLFFDTDPTLMTAKEHVAFRSGFLGVNSLGFSTLVVVTEASPAEREGAVALLAGHLRAHFGAPDEASAFAAAEEEVAFAASLCHHLINTVVALQRTQEDGVIRERFRTLEPRLPTAGGDPLHAHARAFTFVETEDEAMAENERINLIGLLAGKN